MATLGVAEDQSKVQKTANWLGAGVFEQAQNNPYETALVLSDVKMSYGQLAATALRWAGALSVARGGRAQRVGLLAYRDTVSYVGALAALAVGAAFVPLNVKYPLERTRAMIAAADLDVILVSSAQIPLLELLRDCLAPATVVGFPETDGADLPALGANHTVLSAVDLAMAPPLDGPCHAETSDLAYLLFTSGSTGRPKGVPISHGNVRAFIQVNQQRYQIRPGDRLSQTFEQTFDLSVFDMFMAWEHGATLCPADPIELLDPVRYVAKHGLTVWFSVPSVTSAVLKGAGLPAGSMPSLRLSLFCGEALPQEACEMWQAAASESVVENLYGPTELTIACSVYRWDSERSPGACELGVVPIGDLYAGMPALVLGAHDRPVDAGDVGELCVTGPQMTAGYWRAPELDVDRFVVVEGIRYYRTGDRVRETPAGLVHLGRLDSQVQVGGHRVELGEVEAALRSAGCVQAACLLMPSGRALSAFVSGAVDVDVVRSRITEIIPRYMVPQSITLLDAFPLNASGKVDRLALRRLVSEGGER